MNSKCAELGEKLYQHFGTVPTHREIIMAVLDVVYYQGRSDATAEVFKIISVKGRAATTMSRIRRKKVTL